MLIDPNLENIKKFHAELVLVAETGLPVELGMGESTVRLVDVLARTTDRIASALQQGSSLEEVIEADEQLSETYRTALWVWLFCDQSHVALETVTASGTTRTQLRQLFQLAVVQPFVLAAIGYFAFIFICSSTVPKFESLNAQLERPPGMVLTMLSSARDAMWLWIPLVPITLMVVSVGLYRRAGKRPATIGHRHNSLWERISNATFAERVVCFLEQQIPITRAMALAGFHPPESSEVTGPTFVRDKNKLKTDPLRGQLSPLLVWATQETVTEEARVSALRFVAQTYRRFTAMQIHRGRQWWPMIAVVVFGGFIVLGISLSVFLLAIEFLMHVSSQG